MTNEQKEKIKELRLQGMGYKGIANIINLSRDSVRSFCKRNSLEGMSALAILNIEEKIQKNVLCSCCMKPLKQKTTGKNRRFCSDSCRRKWWKEHQEARNPKASAIYHFTCSYCGSTFTAYGNNKRKYCNHSCYIKDRFGEVEPSENNEGWISIGGETNGV